MVLRPLALIRRRTSSCPSEVHAQIGWTAAGLYASPSVSVMSCSTSPVHEPHEADALVCARTSSREVRPFSLIRPVILPLHTPLQPQISASSGNAATAAIGSRGEPP